MPVKISALPAQGTEPGLTFEIAIVDQESPRVTRRIQLDTLFESLQTQIDEHEHEVRLFILIPTVYEALEDAQILMEFYAPHTFTLPVNLLDSSGRVFGTNADAESIISIKRNDSEIATITFPADTVTATVAAAQNNTFVAGIDKFTLVGPATADVDLAGFTMVIKGTL